MSYLQFKLVFPPYGTAMHDWELLSNVEAFKMYIQNYSIFVKANEILRIAKEEGRPHFTELEVAITALYIIQEVGNVQAYQHLVTKWIDFSNSLAKYDKVQRSLPLLMISDHKAFKRSNQSIHHVLVSDVVIGILPFPWEFVSYVSLDCGSIVLNKNIDFCHDQSKVDISMEHSNSDWVFTFPYRNIRRILINLNKSDGTVDLYLDLLHPPQLYQREMKRSKYIGPYEVRKRKLEIMPHLTKDIFGKTNVLKFELRENPSRVAEIISRLHYRCQDLPVYYTHVKQTLKSAICSKYRIPYFLEPKIHFPNFGCQYLFSAILQRNFYVSEQCQRCFEMETLNYYLQSFESKHIEKALTDILFAIDSGKYVYFPTALSSLCEYYKLNIESNNFDDYIVPEKSRLIRRVTITPTRLLLWPPEIMFENRVLRNYDPEFALRVNFRDDDMSRLSWMALYMDEQIFENAIRIPMLSGIVIGNRNFKFLGWSNSQIRDHGVWCYATDELERGVHDIRKWMGDFSHIKTVPKYMARMGQSFSQTEDSISVPLNQDHIRFERDITGDLDPSYCFSDGIGKISLKLAKKVHQTLGHDKHCCAFQVRYGGCKGMLVIDPTLEDVDIVFRDSMKKFNSPQNTRLEIAKTSGPIPLKLNRPFITLLNQMGVPTRIFLQLQENSLSTLTDILLDEEKAVDYLNSASPLSVLKFKELSKSGISLTTEPFFRQMLLSLHIYHIGKLKTHANIAIDPSEGRNMFGVLDETGTLEYGQVFVQYSKDLSLGETTLDTEILKGTVLVTKNPCMHPGDIRKFTAVDVPALHHIVDCIVFPQKGPRPHPNEMAGSDLDGDEYAVLWKDELIFTKPNAVPAYYPSSSAEENMIIQDQHMVAFLIEYIRNDQVGVIANAHLGLADQFGIHDPRCIQIANKFSVAVDYAKNGTKMQLQMDEKPNLFPDFMEKSYKTTYKSDRALGKLFRVCKDFESTNITVSLQAPVVEVDPDLVYPGWERYQQEAKKSLDKYINLLSLILQTYGVQYEAEAFSGAYSQLHCRFQERKDRAEIEKVVNASIKALCKNMEKEFFSEIDGNVDGDVLADKPDLVPCLLQKASAWYMVTYSNPDIGFLSFPWIVSKYLANIKIQKLHKNISMNIRMPIINRINSAIYGKLSSIPPLGLDAFREFNKSTFLKDFERDIVELALRVMMMWAYDAHIIQAEGCPNRGFLFRGKFAHLFLHVIKMERNGNEGGEQMNTSKKGNMTAAAYCLAFLRFCVSLRFYNKKEIKQHLPFEVRKYKVLASQAMTNYHDIALTGIFHILEFDKEQNGGLIEMKPEYIDISVFRSIRITPESLLQLTKEFEMQTGVTEVALREYQSTKKIIVSAIGTQGSILRLKRILRKENKLNNIIETVKSQLGLFIGCDLHEDRDLHMRDHLPFLHEDRDLCMADHLSLLNEDLYMEDDMSLLHEDLYMEDDMSLLNDDLYMEDDMSLLNEDRDLYMEERLY